MTYLMYKTGIIRGQMDLAAGLKRKVMRGFPESVNNTVIEKPCVMSSKIEHHTQKSTIYINIKLNR